ncbi:MAG TPA: DinB family protein [Gemmatimonadales bacterium]|jgi:uncharacterized damage-inducible protein DinB|nr:DinB family protein [Gemmatimonadales bacterium]
MSSETARIADELRRAHESGAWHGSSALEIFAGVTAREAAAHPIPDAHSIWEIVHHLAAWRGEVRRRLASGGPGVPAEGDWPPVTDSSEAAWRATLDRLDAASRELRKAVEAFPERRLDEPVSPDSHPELGTVGSYYVMLHGIAQHDAYHLGQVSLLKKAVRGGRR